MEREEIRLELLKLTYTHGRDASEAVERAKGLETYIFDEGRPLPKPRGRPPKVREAP